MHEIALEALTDAFSDLKELSSLVTLIQFGSCFLGPCIVSRCRVCETFPKTIRQTAPYAGLSLVVFGATGLATQSLKYVSYPTKVIFKSAKLIPTMVVSTFVNRGFSHYEPLDYLAAALLCAGAAGYGFGSGSDSKHSDSTKGIILLIVSILCDALVPNLQQRLMSPRIFPSKIQLRMNRNNGSNESNGGLGLSAPALMVNVNAVGFCCLFLFMTLSGSLFSAIHYTVEHPMLLFYLMLVGLGLSTAVLSYTHLIKESGSVTAVAVSTMRKVFTVLLSYVIFPKALLPIHIVSGLLVLAGVLVQSFCKKRRRS